MQHNITMLIKNMKSYLICFWYFVE